jgi:hypothetical protein
MTSTNFFNQFKSAAQNALISFCKSFLTAGDLITSAFASHKLGEIAKVKIFSVEGELDCDKFKIYLARKYDEGEDFYDYLKEIIMSSYVRIENTKIPINEVLMTISVYCELMSRKKFSMKKKISSNQLEAVEKLMTDDHFKNFLLAYTNLIEKQDQSEDSDDYSDGTLKDDTNSGTFKQDSNSRKRRRI